jgi:acylphosphatase
MRERTAIRLVIKGRVQGVGYRWWATGRARELGLYGWVRNRRDGTVEILAIGPATLLDLFAGACQDGPAGAWVRAVERMPAEDDGSREFSHLPTL